ncbi:hypothetical protein IID27_00495 [Patescibacteria group bacterium]|nr:hypothetical protein [Patescibacteria group bacterium]
MIGELVKDFFTLFYSGLFVSSVAVFTKTAVIWLPIFLAVTFWKIWIRYIQKKFILSFDYTLLEIRLPVEIQKSPLAMEVVLNGLHISFGETTWIDRYIHGKSRPWLSLELVSIDGEVHFYIWGRSNQKNVIEAQLYAQYPEVEIIEVEDYARKVQFKVGETALWGCDFKLTKPDAYPIKTYVDYGLDKDPKEEFKVDPLTNVIEFLGSLQKGEQVWYQIIIEKERDRKKKGVLFGSTVFRQTDWKKEADELIKKLRAETIPEMPGEHFPGIPNPTRGQIETMAAIERSISKQGFSCGIRGIYFAEKDKFDPSNIGPLLSSFKQFSSKTLNGFVPTRWLVIFDYPWQDFRDIRKNRRRVRLLDAYRRRSWFHPPYKTPSYVLNTEELATLFHFPGQTTQTPTLSRISSKRKEAPPNLPR